MIEPEPKRGRWSLASCSNGMHLIKQTKNTLLLFCQNTQKDIMHNLRIKQMTPEVQMHLFVFANIIKQLSSNLLITNLNDFNLDASGPV